jgi:hypothetical protein
MRVMTLTVDIEEREQDEWGAVVHDDEYPYLVIRFEYELTEDRLVRSGFCVRWDRDGAGLASEIGLYEIRRDFPIKAWELAAQAHVVEAIDLARDEAEQGEPHVEPTSSGEAGIPRLMTIAIEYKKNIWDGVPDPVAAIARRHGVKPETARSWVHRARKKGYLGPTKPGKAGVSAPGRRRVAWPEGLE